MDMCQFTIHYEGELTVLTWTNQNILRAIHVWEEMTGAMAR